MHAAARPRARLHKCNLHHAPLPAPFPILQRMFQMYNRLPDYQLVRMAVTLMVGFVFGSLAWKQGSNS